MIMSTIFGDQLDNRTAAWHPEPRGRGTYSILSTSLMTLVLCVWTAVHLNLPEYEKEYMQKYRKASWLVLGLLAPEIVAWNAWAQYRQASRLTKLFQKTFKQTPRPSWHSRFWRACGNVFQQLATKTHLDKAGEMQPETDLGEDPLHRESIKPDDRHPWTLTHGFYAGMGGFAIERQHSGQNYLTNDVQRMVLRERALGFLLEALPDVFPNLSESQILDKSKADSLSKTIICLQAIWFCVQCVSRLALHNAISLMEVNVLGHCLCTLITHALWWHKPTDVTEPSYISDLGDTKLHEHIARMLLTDDRRQFDLQVSAPLKECILRVSLIEDTEFSRVPDEIEFSRIAHSITLGDRLASRIKSMKCCLQSRGVIIKLCLQVQSENIEILLSAGTIRSLQVNTREEERTIDLYRRDAERLDLAVGSPVQEHSAQDLFLATRIPNWTIMYIWSNILEYFKDFTSLMSDLWLYHKHEPAITTIGIVYGGLHLLAWNAPFPNAVQKMLWRLSAIVLASGGPVYMVFLYLMCLLNEKRSPTKTPMWIQRALTRLLQIPFVSWLLLHLFSRVYVVIECFISLPYLPDSVFTTPNFLLYIPHFS